MMIIVVVVRPDPWSRLSGVGVPWDEYMSPLKSSTIDCRSRLCLMQYSNCLCWFNIELTQQSLYYVVFVCQLMAVFVTLPACHTQLRLTRLTYACAAAILCRSASRGEWLWLTSVWRPLHGAWTYAWHAKHTLQCLSPRRREHIADAADDGASDLRSGGRTALLLGDCHPQLSDLGP